MDNTIYEVPIMYAESGLTENILSKMNLPLHLLRLDTWSKFVQRIIEPEHEVKVALIGKYTQYRDSYKSILEAFSHAGSVNSTRVCVELIDSENLNEKTVEKELEGLNGVLVGPGFGSRGIEGKIAAIKYVRETKTPFFGICLGLQCAVIEFSRNVCNLKNANSGEFNNRSRYKVIDLMEEQKKIKNKGGTMRLGAYPCKLKSNTNAHKAYGKEKISERHRHRYELNNKFRDVLQENGMILSGLSPDEKLVEMIEIQDHPWFVGTQFHPELKSRAVKGHPLFISFIKAALKHKNSSLNK